MSIHEEVTQAIHRQIELLAEAVTLSPRQLAIAVQDSWNLTGVQPQVQYCTLEHLTQMARRVLASRYEPESADSSAYQGELFSGTLQSHYPIPTQSGDAVYKRTEFLTQDEISWNVEKLRKSAAARVRHADALLAWAEQRRLRPAA